jgi:polyhydroxyalkanoate synthesis repressor PhaR
MQQSEKTVIIRKYANRRLYDTASRKYVNLDDIAAQVRQGADVRVVDAKTGEDLTRIVLTQIILEDAKGQPTGLPLELLRQLIQASDRAGQEFIMWYLNAAFDAYHKVQETIQTRLSDMRTAALSPLHLVKTFFGGAPPVETGAELEQLRLRIAELEAALKKGR